MSNLAAISTARSGRTEEINKAVEGQISLAGDIESQLRNIRDRLLSPPAEAPGKLDACPSRPGSLGYILDKQDVLREMLTRIGGLVQELDREV